MDLDGVAESDSTWNELCFEEGAKKKILLTQKPPPKEKRGICQSIFL